MTGYLTYQEYKHSGLESYGQIPKHWQVMPIKFSLDMPITDGPHSTPIFYSEGIPFLSAEAVKSDRLNFDQKRGFISIEDHELFSKKYKPKFGDVYMVKSGATTGSVARVQTHQEFNIWSPLAVLRPNSEMTLTDFIFFVLKSKPFFYAVEQSWSYGTQQNIGMGVISNIRIALPPKDEQKKIADFLDYKTTQIDVLITKKETLLFKLKEKRSALISQAVTKGINPNVPMKPSGIEWLGDVPAHWKVASLRHIFNIKAGGDLKEDLYSKTKTDEHIYPIYTNAIKSDAVYGYSAKAFFSSNSITVTGRGEVGYAIYRDHDYDAIIRLLVLTPKNKEKCKFFAYFINAILDFYGGNTAVSQLSTEQIGPYKTCIPPSDEQQTIVKFLDEKIDEIQYQEQKIKHAISLLQEYRSALITNAVTGKIDVKDTIVPNISS